MIVCLFVHLKMQLARLLSLNANQQLTQINEKYPFVNTDGTKFLIHFIEWS